MPGQPVGSGLDLRTTGAIVIFVVVLLGYTLQTELAQYVQLTYRKPYFLLWLTHSGYCLLLPLHLLTLRLLGSSPSEALSILRGVLRIQYGTPPATVDPHHRPSYTRSLSRSSLPDREERPAVKRRTSLRRLLGDSRERSRGRKYWKWRLGRTVACLTLLITMPALSCFLPQCLPFVLADITAIYNVFAFWAYLLAIKFLGERPTRWKLGSVVLAVSGVFVIAYGDSFLASHEEGEEVLMAESGGSERFVGNLLALFGSISYAWYEVWYKMHVALPDPVDEEEEEADALLHEEQDLDAEATVSGTSSPTPSPYPPPSSILSVSILDPAITNPSNATFLLYSNVITSLIGFTTFFLLWIPIPFLHWIGWEEFELPPRSLILPIGGIILSGVLFNAGFMILLSLWGPVIASVGNLCTLGLVAVADTLVAGHNTLSRWSLLGGSMIVGAFGMLILGAMGEENEESGEEG